MLNENTNMHSNLLVRNLLLKILIIFSIIVLVAFLVPSFANYKKTNKKVNSDTIKIAEKNVKDGNISSNLNSLTNASLLFFKDNNIPTKKDDKTTVLLKTLYDKKLTAKLVSSNGTECSSDKSYAKLKKLDSDYQLKVYLKCGNRADYVISHVGKYSYCSTTLCEKDPVKELELFNKSNNSNNSSNSSDTSKTPTVVNINDDSSKIDDSKNDNTDNNSSSTKAVTPTKITKTWSKWSDYKRDNCSVTDIKCNSNDSNCNREVETKKVQEQIGTYDKNYNIYPLELKNKGSVNGYFCNNYNFFYINGVLYRSTGNYEEILNINGYSTNNWTYVGRQKLSDIPNFGGYMYYKFVTLDDDNKTYIFDVYKYNKDLNKGDINNCSKTYRSVNSYNVVKNTYGITRKAPVYATACYSRERVR